MKKILIGFILVLALASVSFADSYEAITVAGTAIGTTSATVGRASWGICRLEGAEIRYTLNGSTTPTSTVGVPLEPYEWVILENRYQLKNFNAIRTTGTSGSLKCHYFD